MRKLNSTHSMTINMPLTLTYQLKSKFENSEQKIVVKTSLARSYFMWAPIMVIMALHRSVLLILILNHKSLPSTQCLQAMVCPVFFRRGLSGYVLKTFLTNIRESALQSVLAKKPLTNWLIINYSWYLSSQQKLFQLSNIS